MTFDYIIAGGGVAGSVLANRLSENGTLKILLIEAGDTQKSSSIVPGLYAFTYNNSATFNFTASASANYSNVYKNFQLPIYQGRAM
jgi:choline dehydrogenase